MVERVSLGTRRHKILLLPQCCPKVAPFARLLTAALVDGRWNSGHRRRLLRTIGSAKAGPRVGAARIQMPRWLALFFFAAARMSRNFGSTGNQALSPPVHDIPSCGNEGEHRAHASARVIAREPIRYVQRGNAPAIEGYTVAGCAGRFPPVGCRRALPCRLFCCSSPWARAPSASANVCRRLPR